MYLYGVVMACAVINALALSVGIPVLFLSWYLVAVSTQTIVFLGCVLMVCILSGCGWQGERWSNVAHC